MQANIEKLGVQDDEIVVVMLELMLSHLQLVEESQRGWRSIRFGIMAMVH